MKMKFLFTVLIASMVSLSSFVAKPVAPAAPVVKPVNARDIYIPIGGKAGMKVSLYELRSMKQSELEQLTGRKMNFFERVSFKTAQQKLQKQISDDGTVTGSMLKKAMGSAADGTTGFHLGGFALGFLASIIGVLIAYLIEDGKKRNRIKWAWIGLIASVIIFGGLFII